MDQEVIFNNNRKWANSKLRDNENYFLKLSRGQHPKILYVGCSDSRVTAEEILGLQPGEVFVFRNIANMIPNSDICAMTVINYAIECLKVEDIIICGHYNCGGIDSALKHEDLGILNPWLRNIRDVYRLYKRDLDKISDLERRNDKLVELNVKEQCINVMKTAEVQKAMVERQVRIHGWVFNVKTGLLIDLKLDFPKILSKIMEIYRLS